MTYHVGVDVGGTFTDVLLINAETGAMWRSKVPSTPEDQSVGVLRGIEKACGEAEVELSAVSHVRHGTTVATNAVLEGKGAKVGLVTTAGFRQVLQIARSFVPGGLAGWIIWPKPEPLAALENTIEVRERVDTSGDVVIELDEDDARAQIAVLRERGVHTVCVSLINSFANDRHERRLAELLAEELPGVPVSISSRVLPEMREYERTLTTVANGYVRVQVGEYIRRLEEKISDGGVDAELSLLRSDGGLSAPAAAGERPVALLMSGPAGGVTGATWAAKAADVGDFLTFDMGGTSTDVALVEGYRPHIAKDTKVGDLNIRVSSIDVRTVGAGGGSIAHVPQLTRALRVGPQSAGAVPGPAAYDMGGTEPTVTDANVVLGYLPDELAGGEIRLDVDAARAAVGSLQESTGLDSVEAVAAGIIDIVNENILGAIRLVSVQKGYDPRDFALVAFGGAGPLHGNAIGRLLGSWPVIIPPSPGVLNAYGDIMTNHREEAARTILREIRTLTAMELAEEFDRLAQTTRTRLSDVGVEVDDIEYSYRADVRYHGQGFELTVDVDRASLVREDGVAAIARSFDAEHERLFSFLLDADHEIVSLAVIAAVPVMVIPPVPLENGNADSSRALTKSTRIWVDGEHQEAGIYDRGLLRAGDVIEGPAIVVEMDSTALVLPGHAATVHSGGALLIEPIKE